MAVLVELGVLAVALALAVVVVVALPVVVVVALPVALLLEHPTASTSIKTTAKMGRRRLRFMPRIL